MMNQLTAKFFKKEGLIKRSDYTPPNYLVDHVELFFDIHSESMVKVKGILQMRPNPERSGRNPIILDMGVQISDLTLSINDNPVAIEDFKTGNFSIELPAQDGEFTLTAEVVLNPAANTQYKGLYKSRQVLVTQNESMGFRDIIPFPDRPDVLSTWTTQVKAKKSDYPVILATGDRTDYKENDDGTHVATFESANYKMPSYLYALVAGKFDCLEDEMLMKGDKKPTKLQIYVPPGKKDRAQIAMAALKMAMDWDMKHFGRKYPLEQFRIAAVDDFNAGAMENFGLNVFNASSLLGDPRTALDGSLIGIAVTVEHEYGHTWRGDLVTVRTWHEIALKEGFQSLMDNLFTQTLLGNAVGRISSVRNLRTRQFPKDAGSTAHSIWPSEYEGDPSASMYTVTTYEKGAEVIGMVRSLIGEKKFRDGTDKYFTDFYGKAATIDDLVNCLQAAGNIDLQQFKNWFFQIGTPEIDVTGEYDEAAKTFSLSVKQRPGKANIGPLQFPLFVGFIGPDGEEIPLQLVGDVDQHDLNRGLLNIKKEAETFVFENIFMGSTPSLLRGFSAPVKLHYKYSNEELLKLMKYDSDGFNRYEAGYRIAVQELNRLIKLHQSGQILQVDSGILGAYENVLNDLIEKDATLAADMLVLPDESELVQDFEVYDFEAAKAARDALRLAIAEKFKNRLLELYKNYDALSKEAESDPNASVININAIQKRKVKNICLGYLAEIGDKSEISLIRNQFETAQNMSDEFVALRLLADFPEERASALSSFYEKWKSEELVINRWLLAQGMIDDPSVLKVVRDLFEGPLFDINRPGHVYQLFTFGFANNYIYFHQKDGEGYKLIVDVLLKLKNSDVGSRLVEEAFGDYPKMDSERQDMIKKELTRLIAAEEIPEDVRKRAQKVLA